MSVEVIEKRPCRACGMPIEIIRGPSGRPVPMQRVRTVYVIEEGLFDQDVRTLEGHAEKFVSHFETCPSAERFSKKAKR